MTWAPMNVCYRLMSSTGFIGAQYKGKAVDVLLIARELGAEYIVEGSVRKSGTRVRVTAQLLDAEDGSNLWAESYDRELTADSIFEVQDEISGQIVTIIADAYGRISHPALQKCCPPAIPLSSTRARPLICARSRVSSARIT